MDRHLLTWCCRNRLPGRSELPKMNRMRARRHGLEDEAGNRIARVVRGLDREVDLPGCRTRRHLGCSRNQALKLEPGTVVGHAGDGSDQVVQQGSLDVEPEFLPYSSREITGRYSELVFDARHYIRTFSGSLRRRNWSGFSWHLNCLGRRPSLVL